MKRAFRPTHQDSDREDEIYSGLPRGVKIAAGSLSVAVLSINHACSLLRRNLCNKVKSKIEHRLASNTQNKKS